ncbi:MAG: hypothetical protein ABSG25_09670 [Bryobacteraceae bacterium]
MNEIIILGNGNSRLNHQDFLVNMNLKIWVSNLAFKEHLILPRIDLVGTVHNFVLEEAIKYKKENNLNYEILYMNIIPELKKDYNIFSHYLGYSSGTELVNEALLRGYDKLYLLGFDSLNGKDDCLYTGKVVIKNFVEQMRIIKEKNKLTQVIYNDDIFILSK